jgi:hypothetical protein
VKHIDEVEIRFLRNSATSTRIPTNRAPFLITRANAKASGERVSTRKRGGHATHLLDRS